MTDPTPDLPALIARVRELDAHPHTWKSPWVAHTFEIDCPCPNGEHCGDSHTCEEVEAPKEYPDGQCVVQISVPGLETFAKPTAELIAYYRTAAPLLADECERLRERVARLEEALVTVNVTGTPGGSICAKRGDDHKCGWCRGMWTPCPVAVARAALAKGGE